MDDLPSSHIQNHSIENNLHTCNVARRRQKNNYPLVIFVEIPGPPERSPRAVRVSAGAPPSGTPGGRRNAAPGVLGPCLTRVAGMSRVCLAPRRIQAAASIKPRLASRPEYQYQQEPRLPEQHMKRPQRQAHDAFKFAEYLPRSRGIRRNSPAACAAHHQKFIPVSHGNKPEKVDIAELVDHSKLPHTRAMSTITVRRLPGPKRFRPPPNLPHASIIARRRLTFYVPRPTPLACRRRPGQLVAAVVVGVRGMALHPAPLDFVP